MILGATITSERGKPVTKTGNDRIEFEINIEGKHLASITVLPSGTIVIDEGEDSELIVNEYEYEKANENLKRGKLNEIYPDIFPDK